MFYIASVAVSGRIKRVLTIVGEGEIKRVDLNLFGGGNLHTEITGVPEEFYLFAFVVPENYAPPDGVGNQVVYDLISHSPANHSDRQVEHTFEGIDSGVWRLYTFLFPKNEHFFDYGRNGTMSEPITIEDGGEVSMVVSF